MLELVLASTSPRRRQLLEQAGYVFHTFPVKVSETLKKNLNLTEQIEDLARRKAQAFLQGSNLATNQGFLVIAADTVVTLNNVILGKPKDKKMAEKYLRDLSGARHSVITGVCLVDTVSKREITFHDLTMVEFHTLNEEQISQYIESGEGFDKAGGYGIQGAAGVFVKNYIGSFSNVVGLPMEKLEQVMLQNGWYVSRK